MFDFISLHRSFDRGSVSGVCSSAIKSWTQTGGHVLLWPGWRQRDTTLQGNRNSFPRVFIIAELEKKKLGLKWTNNLFLCSLKREANSRCLGFLASSDFLVLLFCSHGSVTNVKCLNLSKHVDRLLLFRTVWLNISVYS